MLLGRIVKKRSWQIWSDRVGIDEKGQSEMSPSSKMSKEELERDGKCVEKCREEGHWNDSLWFVERLSCDTWRIGMEVHGINWT